MEPSLSREGVSSMMTHDGRSWDLSSVVIPRPIDPGVYVPGTVRRSCGGAELVKITVVDAATGSVAISRAWEIVA